VERQVPFVRESFWTGRTFSSLKQINTGAERWCLRIAGPRNHGTTRKPPLLLFQTIEQSAMLALPTTPFEMVTWAKGQGRSRLPCSGAQQRVLDPVALRGPWKATHAT
jgi:hypothetical protein